MLNNSVVNDQATTRGRDLVPLALLALAQAQQQGVTSVPNAQLRQVLTQASVQSPLDRTKTDGDTVSRFKRTLLNMVSHDNLTREGWARFERTGDRYTGTGNMVITTKGKAYLFDQCLSMLDGQITPADAFGILGPTPNDDSLVSLVLLSLARLQRTKGASVSMEDWRSNVLEMIPDGAGQKSGKALFARAVRVLENPKIPVRPKLLRRLTGERVSLTLHGKARLLEQGFLPMLPSPPLPPAEPAASARRSARP